jgi:steroid 5-alpha reductase family enzyme
MERADRTAVVALPIIILVGAAIAAAGSHNGVTYRGIPLYAACVGLAFVMQWLAFVPAYLSQTEKYFDITGSVTYLAVTVLAVLGAGATDPRSFVLAGAVAVWALRLGSFLYRRIHRAGKDARFDDIKPSFVRFLMTWSLQGLWVTFTIAAALAAITASEGTSLGITALVGVLVWMFGFGFEVVADRQKQQFRADPANQGKFITSGLWARSRHPNYFGEIVLWIGVAIIAAPALRGWQWVTLVSPVFVALLLIYVSGIPMLERRADAEWGGQAEYEAYKARTPVLVPRV